MTLAEFLALLGTASDLAAVEDPIALHGEIQEAAQTLAALGVDDEVLAALNQAGDVAESLVEYVEGAAYAVADRDAQADAALERLGLGGSTDDLAGLEGLEGLTADEIAALAAGAGDEIDEQTMAELAEIEADVLADLAEAAAAGLSGDDLTAAAEAINASGAPRIPRISRVAAQRPHRQTAPPPVSRPVPALVASGGLGVIQPGTRLEEGSQDLADAFQAAIDMGEGGIGKTYFALSKGHGQFNEARTLGRDPELNTAKVRRVQQELVKAGGLTQLNASGGACVPGEVIYDLPILGQAGRPMRDDGGTTRMGARRGSIQTLPVPTMAKVTGGVTIWDDLAGNEKGNPSQETKRVLRIDCDEPDDPTVVDAIVFRLVFGEFRQRFNPEQVAAWIALGRTYHARVAEMKELAVIADGSTDVAMTRELSTTRDVLRGLGKVTSRFRNYHRTGRNMPLRWAAPATLLEQMVEDLAAGRQQGTTDERLAVAEGTIETFLRARRVNVTWFDDGESSDELYGAQLDGDALNWHDSAATYLYPDGMWLHPESPELNIGVYRDHELNDTNDVAMLFETFEATHPHGVESLRLEFDLCPTGFDSADYGTDDALTCAGITS